MVKKRRTGGGRVTPSKKALARAAAAGSPRSPARPRRPAARPSEPATVSASARYTPKQSSYRMRPRWHRLAGWIGVALGVLLALVNDLMLFTENDLLPFGHQEFYLLLAFVIAGSSTWFLGLLDRGTTIYD